MGSKPSYELRIEEWRVGGRSEEHWIGDLVTLSFETEDEAEVFVDFISSAKKLIDSVRGCR